MKLPHRQQGWTFLGVLTVLIVAGIFVSIGFKLAPAYADHRTLQSLMADTVRDRSLLSKSKREIELSVIRRMRLNNTSLPEGFMKITKDKGTVTITIDYEIREPIFHNVDAVMTFTDVFEGKELD